MLKVRLQGTKNDIKWFKKILERSPKIKLLEFSDYFQNKGTDRYTAFTWKLAKQILRKSSKGERA